MPPSLIDDSVIIGDYSLVQWLYTCSRQQPKQETGEYSEITELSPSTKPNDDHAPQSDIVYGQIVQNSETESAIDDLYANVTSNNDYEDPFTVVYSELHRAGE